jgi:acetyl esterase/lipase
MYEEIKRHWFDIPYGDRSEAQKLDIYLPEEGSGPFPVLFHTHGGGFFMMDKRDYQLQPYLMGLKRGYAVVSVNYRMSGEAVFPAGIIDCKTALRFIRAHSGEYHLDPDRVISCGGSSGGNYSEMLCVTQGLQQFEDLTAGWKEYSSAVECGIAWYAPTDFLKMDAQIAANGLTHQMGPHGIPDSPESRYLGGCITELPAEKVEKANPISYLSPDIPPMLLQHGILDCMVPYEQSVMFQEAAEKIAGPGRVELDLFDRAAHCDPLFETSENMNRIFEFIERHLPR